MMLYQHLHAENSADLTSLPNQGPAGEICSGQCKSLRSADSTPSRPRLARHISQFLTSRTGESLTLGELLDTVGPANRFALLLVPSLLALSPATVVFGVATLCGLAMAIIAGQLLLSRRGIWLPAFIRDLSLNRGVLVATIERLGPALSWLEARSRARLLGLVAGPGLFLPLAMIIFLGLALPLLELVPLSATSGGLAATLMALGIVLRDGLLTLLGMMVWAAVAALAVTFAGQAGQMIDAIWSGAA